MKVPTSWHAYQVNLVTKIRESENFTSTAVRT